MARAPWLNRLSYIALLIFAHVLSDRSMVSDGGRRTLRIRARYSGRLILFELVCLAPEALVLVILGAICSQSAVRPLCIEHTAFLYSPLTLPAALESCRWGHKSSHSLGTRCGVTSSGTEIAQVLVVFGAWLFRYFAPVPFRRYVVDLECQSGTAECCILLLPVLAAVACLILSFYKFRNDQTFYNQPSVTPAESHVMIFVQRLLPATANAMNRLQGPQWSIAFH
jgi:hypothetical protein